MVRRARLPVSLAALLVGLLAVACVTRSSPAPGCVRRLFPTFGGCFGKTAILDLSTNAPPCVSITVNNCQGGELQVDNACPEALVFGELVIPAGERALLDLAEDEAGYRLVRRASIPTYAPVAPLTLTFTGTSGRVTVTLSFTKTAPLCP